MLHVGGGVAGRGVRDVCEAAFGSEGLFAEDDFVGEGDHV